MVAEQKSFLDTAGQVSYRALEAGSLAIPLLALWHIFAVGSDGFFQNFELPDVGPVGDLDASEEGVLKSVEAISNWRTVDFVYAAHVAGGAYVALDVAFGLVGKILWGEKKK